MDLNASTLAGVIGAVLTLIGGIVARLLENRTKLLSAQLNIESELRNQLLGRIEALEFQTIASRKREDELLGRIQVLETALRDKEYDLKELQARHGELQKRHEELSHRYAITEESNSSLRDQLLRHYIDNERKTIPPPAPNVIPREPWPGTKEIMRK